MPLARVWGWAIVTLGVFVAAGVGREATHGPAPAPDDGPVDAASGEGPAFTLARFEDPAFASIAVWLPRRPRTPTETLLLLHGNQPGASDPTWMIGFRGEPELAHRLLIAPGLPGADYEWTRPATLAALSSILRRVTTAAGSSPSPTFVVGYSAGASRALAVAAAMERPIAGIIAIAGDVMRPFRGRASGPVGLDGVPVLLVCMTADDGPQTRCALNDANRAALLQHGLRDVEVRRIPGDHSFDRATVARVMGEWLRRH